MCPSATTACGPFLQDLTNRELIIIKSIFFFMLSGVVMIWPWFTIKMHALGITKRDIGILGAINGASFILVPFISGFAGDKIGNFKVLLFSLTLLNALTMPLFPMVPSAVDHQTTYNSSIPGNETVLTTYTNHSKFSEDTLVFREDRNDTTSYSLTIWSYLVVRFLFSLTIGAAWTLFDGSVMSNMQEQDVDYGKQRAWGYLANLLAPLLGGLVVDYITPGNHNSVFYFASGLVVIAALLCLRIDLRYKTPAKHLTKEIWRQCLQPEMLLLLTAVLFIGVFFGFCETYMYMYLAKLGASNTLLGLTITINAPIEFLLQVKMSSIIQKIGHANAIFIGVIGCSVRLLGFSLLINPWYVLILEVIEAIGNGFFLTATLMYCSTLVTPSTIVSYRGIVGSLYWGIGAMLGAIVGGVITEKIGDRLAFRVMSGIALIIAIIYLLGYWTVVKFRKTSNSSNADFTPIPTSNMDS